jgi:hypothetical protein
MKRVFLFLLDPSNDPEFFWQVISGPLYNVSVSEIFPFQKYFHFPSLELFIINSNIRYESIVFIVCTFFVQ